MIRTFILCSAIIAGFSYATRQRVEVWQSPTSLWLDSVSKSPFKVRTRVNLARAYQESGHDTEALEEYRNTLILANRPGVTKINRILANQIASMNASQIFIKHGDLLGAETLLVGVWNQEPGFPGIAANLAVVYILQKRYQMALEILDIGIGETDAYPWFVDVGKLYLLRGQVHDVSGNCALANADYDFAAQNDADIHAKPSHCISK